MPSLDLCQSPRVRYGYHRLSHVVIECAFTYCQGRFSGIAYRLSSTGETSLCSFQHAIRGHSGRLIVVCSISESLARSGHEIVQPKLKSVVNKILKSDAVQHLLQSAYRDTLLMLIKLHLVAHESYPVQHL